MADSGIRHVVAAVPVTQSEYEGEAHHALIHGTSFPSSPSERQLYYRDDLHMWYQYRNVAWRALASAGEMTLDDISDVEVPSPTDQYLLYWDAATSKWKCKAHSGLTTGVHGVGSNYIAKTAQPSQVPDHGELGGLGDDDHPHYLHYQKRWARVAWDSLDAWTPQAIGSGSLSFSLLNLLLSTGTTPDSEQRLRTTGFLANWAGFTGDKCYLNMQWWGTPRTNSEVLLLVINWDVGFPPPLTSKQLGFKVIDGTIWSTSGDGTTEETYSTGISYASDWAIHCLEWRVRDSSHIDFYVDGVLKTTHTLHLPADIQGRPYFSVKTTDAVNKAFCIAYLQILQ